MPEIQSKNFLQSQFSGLVLQRATATNQSSLIQCDNASVEPDGSVRSRAGARTLNTQLLTDGAGGQLVHSIHLQGETHYLGVSSVIKRNFDPGVNIVSGLNGKRVSFVALPPSTAIPTPTVYMQNGQVGCVKADDGATVRRAGIDGPSVGVSVSLASAQPANVPIDDFSAAYTVIGGGGSEGPASDPYLVSSRSFTIPSSQTARFRHTGLSLDLSGLKPTAFIRFMCRVDNRTNLDHIEIAFDVSVAGNFTTDFYYLTIGNSLIGQDGSWTEVKVRLSDFLRIRPTTGSTRDWSTVSAVQFSIAATSRGQIVVSADDMRLEQDSFPDGIYEYCLTWFNNATKTRSNPRALADIYSETFRFSPQITSKRQRIVVDRTAVTTTDSQVSHFELWRRNLNVSEEFLFVTRQTYPATLTYNDDLSDGDLGESLVEDHHVPPPGRYLVEFNGYVFLGGMSNQTAGSTDEEAPWSVRYSQRLTPESWPFSNFVRVGDASDPVRGLAVWGGQVWAFTKKHVYGIIPTGGGFEPRVTEAPIGTEAPYSIASSPQGLFYMAVDGIYLFDGIRSQNISDPFLRPFFKKEPTRIDGLDLPRLDANSPTEYEEICGAYYDGKYYLSAPQTDGQRATLIYDIAGQRWSRALGQGWNLLRLLWAKGGTGSNVSDQLEAGNDLGELRLLETTDPESIVDGDCHPVEVQIATTFDEEVHSGDNEIEVKDLVVEADTGNQPILCQASFNDSSLEVIGVAGAFGRQHLFFPILHEAGKFCYKVSVNLTIQQRTARCQVYAIGLRYSPEPRKAKSHSSRYEFIGRSGWLRRGRIIYRSPQPIQARLLCDGQERYAFTIPSSGNTRAGFNPSVPAGLRAKVMEARFESEAAFGFYTAYFEVSELGQPEGIKPWSLVG